MKDYKKNTAFIYTRAAVGFFLFIIALALFSLIAQEVVIEKEDGLDNIVFTFLKTHSTPFIINLFKNITFFGSVTFLIPAYAILIFFFLYKHRRTDAIDIIILAISSTLLMNLLKIIFARNRPTHPIFQELNSYSFPSGHALTSFVFFSVLTWEFWHSEMNIKLKWVYTIFFLLFSLTIGISRIVLRYHYASDVLAGFCIGLAYVLFYFWLTKRWRTKQDRVN